MRWGSGKSLNEHLILIIFKLSKNKLLCCTYNQHVEIPTDVDEHFHIDGNFSLKKNLEKFIFESRENKNFPLTEKLDEKSNKEQLPKFPWHLKRAEQSTLFVVQFPFKTSSDPQFFSIPFVLALLTKKKRIKKFLILKCCQMCLPYSCTIFILEAICTHRHKT